MSRSAIGQSFEDWMDRVDNIIAEQLDGRTSEDLPDCSYLEWYEGEKLTPAQAAERAISLAKGGDT